MHPSRSITILAVLIFFSFNHNVIAWGNPRHIGGGLEYLSPLPDARYVRPESHLILRFSQQVGLSNDELSDVITVKGSKSGPIIGEFSVLADRKTVIFKPEQIFQFDERITVRIGKDVFPQGVGSDAIYTYSFSTTKRNVDRPSHTLDLLNILGIPDHNGWSGPPSDMTSPDTLPPDFPEIQTTVYDTTSSGYLFLSNFKFEFPPTTTSFLMILDNSGSPVFYREMPGISVDFKLQPNGLLTYFDDASGGFFALDSFYTVVDSFRCGNGYSTDLHELRLLDDGHALLMSYDYQPVDMSEIVPGGDSNATVIGLVVQEIDSSKNVVFQWRSWDHFLITDAIDVNLTDTVVDYVHGNAIELDTDGNLLISCRHMSEITKIDRTTGDIIWRLGGKNNEFTFIDDTIGFSYQHHIRRLPNGHVTLFDNGNGHVPPFSRGVEYALDETTKTATLVWQYRESPDNYGFAMGSVQRLPGGNTIIGWGSTSPAVTEVKSDGSKVFELSFAPGVYNYRTFRFDWVPAVVDIPPDIPRTAYLLQNYPNPFNSGTRISFSLTRASTVSLKVYDLLGREVALVLDHQRRGVGDYDIDLDFHLFSAGVYVYRLVTDEYSEVRKMVYLP